MKSELRSRTFGLRTLGAAGAAVLLVATLVQAAGASPAARAAAHPCLVMTGAGDPAFTKNFNPYAGGGLPSNAFVQGAFYEPLIVVPAGGRKTIPWLARSWKWSNGNTTLTLSLAQNAKWSDGQPLTAEDVVYSLTAGRQNKAMDRIGLVGPGNNVASVKATASTASRSPSRRPTRSSSQQG